jgi:hypothetical protein
VTRQPARCAVLGHDFAFAVDDAGSLVWECRRGCGAGGRKAYQDVAQSRRMAAALNRKDSDDLGRRAPLIGLLPLRIWRRLRHGPLPVDTSELGAQHSKQARPSDDGDRHGE